MFFFMALRNIYRHKKESLIITALIAVITFLFFIGNTFLLQADRSIHMAFAESLTGDIIIQKTTDPTMNLFGANAPVIDDFFEIPVLPAYDAIMDIISSEAGIAEITSQVSGRAFLDLLGVREAALLIGMDTETYFSFFPGIVLEEGGFLIPYEYGAMITMERVQRIEERSGIRPEIGMPLLFTSGGEFGFKIREVPLAGIFSYANPGQFMNEIILMDPQTVRVLNSIQVASSGIIDESSENLLWDSFDDLFGSAFMFQEDDTDIEFSPFLLENFLNEPVLSEETETGGDWNFILLRLENGISPGRFISALNRKLEPFGVNAVNWRIAAGNSAILLLLVQALFNAGVLFIGVVGVIAIVNIFLISVFRRFREIGTLRAIGASDSYIRSLIYSENITISFLAGIMGVLMGILFINWVNSLNLAVNNELIVSIINKPVLFMDFSFSVILVSIGLSLFLGSAGAVYPVETAVRLEPMAAVRQG